MSQLVLLDSKGRVSRSFLADEQSDQLIVVKDQRTRRLHVLSTLEGWDQKANPVEVLKEFTPDMLKKNPFILGELGSLSFVEAIQDVVTDDKRAATEDDSWKQILIGVAIVFLVFMLGIKNIPRTTANMEEELKSQIVKIREMAPKPVVTQVKVRPRVASQTRAPVTPKTQNIKRMGALQALGSLKQGKNAGLNLGAVETSRGPGLGGTQGSGGTQQSLYAKGMVAAPLGAGNNLQGAGGYGTKGRGGGQDGFGQMQLSGSLGAEALPVGQEAQVAKGLDRDQIAAVIQRNSGQVRFCYEQGLQQDATLSGRVTVDFTIGGNGLVKMASVGPSTLKSASVQDCIVSRLRSWKFPLPEGGVDVKVSYPFTLRRAGQG